jgi:hypothetical protein
MVKGMKREKSGTYGAGREKTKMNYVAKPWKQPRCSKTGKCIKKMRIYIYIQ